MGDFSFFTSTQKKGEANASRLRWKPGSYEFEVLSCKADRKRKGGVAYFAADLKITASNNPNIPVGAVVGWYQGYDKEGAENRVATFLMALGYSEDDVQDEETLAKIVDPKIQDAAGAKGRVVVEETKTSAGLPFNAPTFLAA